jgi:hypothetical protein
MSKNRNETNHVAAERASGRYLYFLMIFLGMMSAFGPFLSDN